MNLHIYGREHALKNQEIGVDGSNMSRSETMAWIK